MKIIYVHHGNRKRGNPSTQEDDLTEIGYKDCNIVAELLNDKKIKMLADSGDEKAMQVNESLKNTAFKVSALKSGQMLCSFCAVALAELTFFTRFFDLCSN